MKNAVIIGAGPAGFSAAIYLIRAGIQTTVIYKDMGALGKTSAIDNYYGFPETISGPELFERGIAQARRLGVEIIQDEVVGISWEDKMTVLTKTGRDRRRPCFAKDRWPQRPRRPRRELLCSVRCLLLSEP